MLCFKRHKDGEIILTTSDGRIRIVILEIGQGWVRVGTEAPDCVAVHRGEIQRRIDEGERK